MLEILESPKHLVAIRLSGSLTADDVSKAYRATDDALKENERVSFFVEVEDSMILTFEGLLKDLLEGIGQLGKLSRYYRAALITEKGWLGALARVEGLVFCSIDVRVFGPDEGNMAFAWASEQPEPLPKPAEPEPGIHFLQTTSENVFAYEIAGTIRERDIKAAVEEFNRYLEKEGRVNVLARMKNYEGFDLSAILTDELFRMKFRALSKIDKYAVVAPKPWMRNLLELMAPLTGVTVRTFDESEGDEAWEWVGARQALLSE